MGEAPARRQHAPDALQGGQGLPLVVDRIKRGDVIECVFKLAVFRQGRGIPGAVNDVRKSGRRGGGFGNPDDLGVHVNSRKAAVGKRSSHQVQCNTFTAPQIAHADAVFKSGRHPAAIHRREEMIDKYLSMFGIGQFRHERLKFRVI